MNISVHSVYEKSKNISGNQNAPDSFCPLPWTHISIRTNGIYRVCCSSGGKGILRDKNNKPFHALTAKWDDVINCDLMKSIRRDMLAGKWPDSCIQCKTVFKKNKKSRNISERLLLQSALEHKNYPSYNRAKNITTEDGCLNKKNSIGSLDIRLGNHCNLKCITCNPTESNKWYNDIVKISNNNFFYSNGIKVQLFKNSNNKWTDNLFGWSKSDLLQKQIYNNIKNLKKIHLAGGEPFLIEAHYKILKQFIERGAAETVTLYYHSNITVLPDSVLEMWKKFKKVIINASCDGIGSVNDYVRFPSKWKQIEANLEKLDSLDGNYNVTIQATISILNIWHLPKFLIYIMRKNFKRVGVSPSPDILFAQPLNEPIFLNVNILTDEAKRNIKKVFANYMKCVSEKKWDDEVGPSKAFSWDEKVKKFKEILDFYVYYMNSKTLPAEELMETRKLSVDYLNKLDVQRGTNWKNVCPELYKYTKNWPNIRVDSHKDKLQLILMSS